jgi:hypothetical protein
LVKVGAKPLRLTWIVAGHFPGGDDGGVLVTLAVFVFGGGRLQAA